MIIFFQYIKYHFFCQALKQKAVLSFLRERTAFIEDYSSDYGASGSVFEIGAYS